MSDTPSRSGTAQVMLAALSQVVESMAFEMVELTSESEGWPATVSPDATWMATRLRVINPRPGGIISLWLPRDVMMALAETINGVPAAEIDDAMLDDNLTEFLNMVSGRFMAEFSPGSAFELGLPEISTGATPPLPAPSRHAAFSITAGPIVMGCSGCIAR